MKPSRTALSAPVMRPDSDIASSPLPERSPQSFSVANASAMFWPSPEKLKPWIDTRSLTSGCCITNSPAWAITACVRSWVAPGGSCVFRITTPWSSTGRKEVGRRMNSSATQAITAT